MFLSFIHSFEGLLKLASKNQSLLLTFCYILDYDLVLQQKYLWYLQN